LAQTLPDLEPSRSGVVALGIPTAPVISYWSPKEASTSHWPPTASSALRGQSQSGAAAGSTPPLTFLAAPAPFPGHHTANAIAPPRRGTSMSPPHGAPAPTSAPPLAATVAHHIPAPSPFPDSAASRPATADAMNGKEGFNVPGVSVRDRARIIAANLGGKDPVPRGGPR
jgi:hypothetical protein